MLENKCSLSEIFTLIKYMYSKSSHSKIDRGKALKTNGSIMKVKSIAECSLGAFCNTFDLYSVIIGLENHFWSSF